MGRSLVRCRWHQAIMALRWEANYCNFCAFLIELSLISALFFQEDDSAPNMSGREDIDQIDLLSDS
ncbi:hypothetical protein ACOSQ3_004840 [Xanthoceras sorbifolium]